MSIDPLPPTAVSPTSHSAAPTERNGRTPFWILLSVVVGFMLPVCACAVFMASSMLGFSMLGSSLGSTTPASSGVGDAVALIRIQGAISDGDDADIATGAVSGTVIADLKAAAEDDSIKAIVLRVDSPGGTVTGSAQIYEAILEIEKPVVVSMAGVAASGGYYVSAPADYIFARPETTTGSLGVVITLYDVRELMDKVGVDVISLGSGPNKGIGNPWELLTEEQEAIFDSMIDEMYDEFVRVIADGRNLPEATVRQLADGRIYTGRQALANGLIDELGDLEEAIAKAAQLGGISGEPRIVEYEHLPSLSSMLFGFSSQVNRSEAEQSIDLINELITPKIEYRYIGPGAN